MYTSEDGLILFQQIKQNYHFTIELIKKCDLPDKVNKWIVF